MKLSYFFEKIQDVKLGDMLSAFPMLTALILKPFYRKKYSGAWLVCEDPAEARDNGYHFFRYMCRQHPEQRCVYAIRRKSPDAAKVEYLGQVVEHGGVLHWIIYFLCEKNISSQKGGKPNAALCAFLELNHIFSPNNVFLQHGVIINDLEWLYADRSRIDLFVTSAFPEWEFIRERFGYADGVVQLLGMPRLDALHNVEVKKNRILIMPTWRNWFVQKSKQTDETDNAFKNSQYLREWRDFLNSEKLLQVAEKNNLEIVFYIHRNLQRYLDEFGDINERITMASWRDYDIQELLKSSAAMITDYSSVFFDMVYMKKPVIFFQFDEEMFRKHQYREGYFDYHNTPFGEFCETKEKVIDCLTQLLQRGFEPSAEYLSEHKKYFTLYDAQNCERIYQYLKEQT